jgi:hypothetical protein
MKKISILLAVLSFAAVACGSSQPESETPAGDSTATATPASDSAAPAADTAAPADTGTAAPATSAE